MICLRFRSHPVWQREQQFRMRSPGSSPEAQVIQSHLSFCIATAATAPPVLVRAQRMPSAQPDSVPTLLLACREFGGEFSASRSPEAIELGRIDVTCKVCSNFSSACLRHFWCRSLTDLILRQIRGMLLRREVRRPDSIRPNS